MRFLYGPKRWDLVLLLRNKGEARLLSPKSLLFNKGYLNLETLTLEQVPPIFRNSDGSFQIRTLTHQLPCAYDLYEKIATEVKIWFESWYGSTNHQSRYWITLWKNIFSPTPNTSYHLHRLCLWCQPCFCVWCW